MKRPALFNNINKHVGKFFTNYLALFLRVCDTFQLAQELLFRVDVNNIDAKVVFEELDHIFFFVLPQ